MSAAVPHGDIRARTRALIGPAIFDVLLAQKNCAAIANLVQGLGAADPAERATLSRFWRELPLAGSALRTLAERAMDHLAAKDTSEPSAPNQSTSPPSAPALASRTSIKVLVEANGLDAFEGERGDERRLAILKRLDKPIPIRPLKASQSGIASVLAAFPWFVDGAAGAAGAAETYARSLRLGERLGRPVLRLPALLLAGPPGIGKSSFLSALVAALGGAVYPDTLAGVSDALSITGANPTFQAAQPSLPVRAMLATGCANPALVLDEIDKVGTDLRFGHPHDALLPILETATAAAYRDRFIDRLIDASHISFAATANETAGLSAALRSRLTIITSPGPGPEHAAILIAGFRKRLAADWQLDETAIPDGGEIALQAARAALRRSADIRPIERAWRAAAERLLAAS